MSFRFLLTITSIFLCFQLRAAENYFSGLSIENGLPSNVTSAIVQDTQGFIWIGTDKGLCRYDAYSMLCFNKENATYPLPSNRISALLIDGDNLWVGTWNQLCLLNTKTFEIEIINEADIKTVRALYKDDEGNIWIGTNTGLYIYNGQTKHFRHFNSNNSQLSHNTIRSFYQDKSGSMWIGTYDGLNRFNGIKFESYNLKGHYKPEIANNLILAIVPVQENDSLLLVGTETGLCFFNKYNTNFYCINTQNSSLSNEVIKSIYIGNNKYWLGTDYGLNVYDYQSGQIESYFHNPHVNHSICNNVVRQIYKDKNELLWFMTANGISLLEQPSQGYSLHEVIDEAKGHKAGNLIRDMLIEKDGTKWLATIHGVICEKTDGSREFFTSKSPWQKRLLIDNVYALEQDNLGQIWIGTAGGINIWNRQEQKMYAITSNKQNGLSSNYIKDIVHLKDGTICVSAWEGGVFLVYNQDNLLPNITFSQLASDSESLICSVNDKLYYTDYQSLIEFNPLTRQSKTIIGHIETTLDSEIITLNTDRANTLMMVYRHGILQYKIDEDQLKLLTFTEPIEQIMSMEVDKNGYFWLSTHNSIIKLNPQAQPTLTIPLNTNAPFKSFQWQSSSQATDGSLFFGGENGYIQLDPSLSFIPKNNILTTISGLSVNNNTLLPNDESQLLTKDISLCNKLTLKHNQNSLMFRFSNLDYWLPELNKYKYQLVGYDTQWQYAAQNQNFAIYSNLPPGDYTFEVKGINHKGIVSQQSDIFNCKIKTPLWLSTGFIAMYLVLIIGIIYLVFYIINYRNRLTNKLKITQLEKEHSEQLLYTKQQFFTNISHEFRTPLSLIVPPIQQVLDTGTIDTNSKHMLKLANKNSQRLMQLVNQILDFRKLETSGLKLNAKPCNVYQLALDVFESFSDLASRNEINYQFSHTSNQYSLAIDQEKIRTILYNLLSNAFKYTPVNGSIELKIKTKNNNLLLSVTDNGKGIALNEQDKIFDRFYQSNIASNVAGTGIGLTLSMEYARLHNGIILLESQTDRGSCFTLQLPLSEIFIDTKDNQTITPPNKTNELLIQTKATNLPSGGPTILIIDDNEDILDFIELNLKTSYRIIRSNNGNDGLQLAVKHRPSVIISDVMMPQMDGNTLCRKIKSNESTMHIPVVLLTAKSLDEQKLEGIKSGADFYVTKPFSIDFLCTCINNLLKRDEQLLNYAKKMMAIAPDKIMSEDKNMDTLFTKRVMTIIENNIADTSFSVEVLANEMGMSSTHLYRKLKGLTGYSTQDIIKNYRLENAAQMLLNKEGNVSEIMYKVGFTGLSTFSKAFKSHFGLSPSEYAKTNINHFNV